MVEGGRERGGPEYKPSHNLDKVAEHVSELQGQARFSIGTVSHDLQGIHADRRFNKKWSKVQEKLARFSPDERGYINDVWFDIVHRGFKPPGFTPERLMAMARLLDDCIEQYTQGRLEPNREAMLRSGDAPVQERPDDSTT